MIVMVMIVVVIVDSTIFFAFFLLGLPLVMTAGPACVA